MSETNSRLLSDITDLYGLHQLINEPTRVTDTTSTLIDLNTNHPDKVVCSGVCHVSISDHSIVFAYRTIGAVSIFAGTLLLKTGMSWTIFKTQMTCGVSGKLSS